MNLSLASFLIWTIAGMLAGRLAGRYSPRPAATGPYLLAGIAGGITGGLLWSPWFWISKEGLGSLPIFVFEFGSFNIFAALCGSTAGFWIVELVLNRQKG